jgi:hypothetical protein
MMLCAFAAELYMKAAYAAENGGRKLWGHSLRGLFKALSASFQDSVRQQWQIAITGDRVVHLAKHNFPGIDFDLDTNLAQSSHAFEQLRYAHEGLPNSFLLGNLPVALLRALLSVHPGWDRELLE